jgi:hypothetical protein
MKNEEMSQRGCIFTFNFKEALPSSHDDIG